MNLPDSADTVVNALVEHFDPRVAFTVFLILAAWFVRRLVLSALVHRSHDPEALYHWRKTSAYVAFFITVGLLGLLWAEEFRSLGTFLGLLSAGLAIALKDLVLGVAGWLFIHLRHPFRVGDRVQIGSNHGDVIDIRLFKFTLMEIGNWVAADQSTGRVIHLPNGEALTKVLVNYTQGFDYLWNEIPVLVTYESDWKKAKRILLEVVEEITGHLAEEARNALRQAGHRYFLYYKTLTPTVYASIADSGILLTIRHLTPPRRRRGVSQEISEKVLDRFLADPDIEFAYPTQRIYLEPGDVGRSLVVPEGMVPEGTAPEGIVPEGAAPGTGGGSPP